MMVTYPVPRHYDGNHILYYYGVVSDHRCVLPYKYRKRLEVLLKLMKVWCHTVCVRRWPRAFEVRWAWVVMVARL